MSDIQDILAANLRSLRGTASQADVAEKAGLSVEVVRGIEQKRTWPKPDNISRLAGALGCAEAALFAAQIPTVVKEHYLRDCLAVVEKWHSEVLKDPDEAAARLLKGKP